MRWKNPIKKYFGCELFRIYLLKIFLYSLVKQKAGRVGHGQGVVVGHHVSHQALGVDVGSFIFVVEAAAVQQNSHGRKCYDFVFLHFILLSCLFLWDKCIARVQCQRLRSLHPQTR